MVLGTKESIIAAKQFATERYIRSTHPVLYLPLWKRDAGGTNLIRSDDAYGHIATVTGATWGSQGRTFVAANSDVITIPDAASLQLTDLTIIVWAKVTTHKDWNVAVAKRDAGGTNYQLHSDNTQKLIFFDGTTSISDTPTFSTGVWYHFVVKVASNLATFYTNGIVGAANQAVSVNLNDAPLLIGYDGVSAGAYFGGSGGEIRVYSRALTAGEIQHDYMATRWRYQ